MAPTVKKVTVFGAGSWGSALALLCQQNGCQTTLWGYDANQIARIKQQGKNHKYLPDIPFPESLQLTADMAMAMDCDVLVLAVPSHAFVETTEKITAYYQQQPIIWATKGLEPATGRFLDQVLTDKLTTADNMALLSGPSFAKEVANGMPTALTLAGSNQALLEKLLPCFHNNNFRVYTNQDLIGVQLGGVFKNIIAVACGVSDGLHFGANARAALITRGLAEMHRLGKKLGAASETMLGLACTGDMILTCTDDQSRNKRFGRFVGQGQSIQQAQQQVGQVVEAVHNVAEVLKLAETHQVELPIVQAVQQVLQGQLSPQAAVEDLFKRSPKAE